MRALGLALIVLFIVSLISFSSASFQITNGSLKRDYLGSEVISGNGYKINISTHEDKDFVSNLGGAISLLNFLNKSGYQKDKQYFCSPSSCKTGYALGSGENNKNLTLDASNNREKVLGFGIVGSGQNSIELTDLSFRISSDLPASCVNPLSIDLLNDGTIDFYDDAYVNEVCNDKKYGCFNASAIINNAIIPWGESLCEKINLVNAPAYKIGAKVKNSTRAPGTLKMSLYDAVSGDQLGRDCALPTLNEAEQELNCIVNYSSRKQFDAYVCISTTSSTSNFSINMESDSNVCGKSGNTNTMDYEISAQELKYAPINKMFNKNLFFDLNPPNELIPLLQNYIDVNYNRNCASGCAIPFKMNSAAGTQNIMIDSILFTYRYGTVEGPLSNGVYEVTGRNFTITSNGTLDLGIDKLGFVVPNVTASRTLYITFDGQTFVGEGITITTGFDYDLIPKNALIKRKTYFALVGSNVSSAQWDFGDGTQGTSTGGTIYHIYNTQGEFNVKVTAKGSGNTTSSQKNFKVVVGNAKDSANLTIKDYEGRIANVTGQINSRQAWIRDDLQAKLNLTDMNYTLSLIKTRFKSAINDSDFLNVVNDLSNLDVPYSVSTSKTGTGIPLSLGYAGLNTKYALELLERTSDSGLVEGITAWIYKNYDAKTDYEIITRYGDSGQTALASWYKITLTPKIQGVESGYFVMDYPQRLVKFNSAYSDRAVGEGEGTYIPTTSDVQTIEFLIPEGVEVTKLGAYIIPVDGANLQVVEETPEEATKPGFNWKVFWIWFAVLVVIAFIAYIALQEWYKKRYENYLFRNPNDLYNLITFISNSRNIKLTDADIRKKLSANKWTGEQISYAFNKLDGKRTGMWEIPIFKSFENRKVAEEISKRNEVNPDNNTPNTTNTKFIKRPQF